MEHIIMFIQPYLCHGTATSGEQSRADDECLRNEVQRDDELQIDVPKQTDTHSGSADEIGRRYQQGVPGNN